MMRDGTTSTDPRLRFVKLADGVIIQVDVEQGREGLLYATSPDLNGLFVAAATVDELNAELPQVIKVLIDVP